MAVAHTKLSGLVFQQSLGEHALKTGSQIRLGQFYFANGTYADLWHGYIEDDIPAVAVKVWRGVKLSRNTLRDVEKRLLKQLDEWKCCEHLNVVPLLGLLPREGNIPSLIIPYYENSDVVRYLRRNPAADRLQLVGDLAAGVGYLHGLRIIHGDIKGSNVLVDSDGNARLCDVGVSKINFPGEWSQAHGTGSARWAAPEIMDPQEEDEEEPLHTSCSDVYSFGMTALEIVTGRQPFAHRRLDTMVVYDVFKQRRPRRPLDCLEMTDSLWSLIESCWCHEPSARLPMDGVNAWISILFQTRAFC